jgi:hypothetical protein
MHGQQPKAGRAAKTASVFRIPRGVRGQGPDEPVFAGNNEGNAARKTGLKQRQQ